MPGVISQSVPVLLRPVCLAVLVLISCSSDGPGANEDTVHQFELEPGQSKTAAIITHCGHKTLQVDINGQVWTTEDLPRAIPREPTWPDGERATLHFTLLDHQTLSVTAKGSEVSLTYHPDPDPPGCA